MLSQEIIGRNELYFSAKVNQHNNRFYDSLSNALIEIRVRNELFGNFVHGKEASHKEEIKPAWLYTD